MKIYGTIDTDSNYLIPNIDTGEKILFVTKDEVYYIGYWDNGYFFDDNSQLQFTEDEIDYVINLP